MKYICTYWDLTFKPDFLAVFVKLKSRILDYENQTDLMQICFYKNNLIELLQ